MKLKLVPPQQGLLWVRHGLKVFFKRPMSFTMLLLIFMLVAPSVVLAIAPLATIAFMLATQHTLLGRVPTPAVYVQPLQVDKARTWAHVRLGLAYAACAVVVYLAAGAAAGDSLANLREALIANKSPEEVAALMADPRVQYWYLVIMGGLGLASVPFWYAPPLIHWGGMGAAKAVFFSTVACWRNKGALALFSLAWFGVVMAMAFVSLTVFTLMGLPQMALAAMVLGGLMLSAAFYASLFFTFADCFEPADTRDLPLDLPPQEPT
ncbi:BPSS1780 family membrane protein [Piscinibacter terrae]|uniref:Uncharacterized protein n=1 Tax=Piscinibacter terrae TaxID=2496871 RepID=A0A3N7K5D6_9BURK|nr:BPSS1780 family membrane protein [Albitalea terrae]RQP26125.1 hypothetical protein DZC73_03525 [Albitalea terrae]